MKSLSTKFIFALSASYLQRWHRRKKKWHYSYIYRLFNGSEV